MFRDHITIYYVWQVPLHSECSTFTNENQLARFLKWYLDIKFYLCNFIFQTLVLICAFSSCFHLGEGDIFISSLWVQKQQRELDKHTRGLTRPWNTSLCSCTLPSITEMHLSLEKCLLISYFWIPQCLYATLYSQSSIR